MRSRTTDRSRSALEALPERVQRGAYRAYQNFRRDPSHPSLQFKKIHQTFPVFSVRVSLGYRAVGRREGDTMIWSWVGSHAEYERLVAKLRRG